MRFILFAFDEHYPSGGMKDMKLRFNTSPELKEWVDSVNSFNDYYQILDTQTCEFVEIECEYEQGYKIEDHRISLISFFDSNFK